MDNQNTTQTTKSYFDIILEKTKSIKNKEKGSIFEKLSKHLLEEKDTANIYKNIIFWNDWSKKDGNDSGIDIIIETNNDQYIAVQCKFYEASKIDLNDLSTYFSKLQSGVGDIKFSKGIIIITNDLTQKARKEIAQISRNIPIELITLEDFINSNIDWEKFDPINSIVLPISNKKKPREHQIQAINKTKEYFANQQNKRGKLIMACGTGKTFTSLKIIETLTPKDSVILFLAPSISLVGQTFREYRKEKTDNFIACIVCSDSKAGKNNNEEENLLELPLSPSTKAQNILEAYKMAKKNNVRFIIFSTYQSIQKIIEAQRLNFIGEIDLMICDEAHRSAGNLYSSNEKDRINDYTKCHNDDFIKAKKRIYMSATPKIYPKSQQSKALENNNEVFSMDDEEIFGNEIYNINFRQAVEQDLLTDYKVIILAIKQDGIADIANKAIAKIKSEIKGDKLIDLEFVCKIIGTHKGLARNDLVTLDENGNIDNDFIEEMDKNRSKSVINFCRSIKASENIKKSFNIIMGCYSELEKRSFADIDIHIDHIDGKMDAATRLQKLNTLASPKINTCNILSNAKCLSEGIDVPTLDSVVFFDGRSSMVDIIQSVGRVMRKAPNKNTGYIILPLAISESELSNLDLAIKDTKFDSIWNILKALRSHDDSLVDEKVFKEKIKIVVADFKDKDKNPSNKSISFETLALNTSNNDEGYTTEEIDNDLLFDTFTLNQLANTMYNAIPTKLGDTGYWKSFNQKTAKIVERLNVRLNAIFVEYPEILSTFIQSLQKNIHPNITENDAIDMICSHIITKPIFDVLFENDINNPIKNALDAVSNELNKVGLDNEETKSLNALYDNIKYNAKLAKSEKSKQELIKNLYNTFFTTAFSKQAKKLGIVYTPIEAIDFILHSINDLLKKHFNTDFNDEMIKVFDPFTGTGSFITRLLSKENNLIKDENLKNIYSKCILAQDIVLLAYYIALTNITKTAQSRIDSIDEFKNIALGDSLNYLEDENTKSIDTLKYAELHENLAKNQEIKNLIEREHIRVIMGNPPYSSGQESQNDNNANIPHPNLEKRIREAYGKEASGNNSGKNNRDTLIQALRMASDRIIQCTTTPPHKAKIIKAA